MAGKQLNPYKKPYSEIAKDLKPEDTEAVLNLTTTVLKNLGGRPATYPNTTQGLDSFIENSLGFFEYVQNANAKLDEKAQIIADVELYCVWLGITRKTLILYRGRGGEWEKVVDYFKEAILGTKKQLMLKGRIPTVIGVLDLVNNHDYYNTNSFTIETKAAAEKPDKNDLESRINEAGLIWDNELKEFVPQGE